ncbi:MAG: murein transglycosylase domain-containing protein, partial [Gammaproteobacteria bacterium]|nr:murein transglycosylase domain-containing protein [Gammaproteobacteria bacterium]
KMRLITCIFIILSCLSIGSCSRYQAASILLSKDPAQAAKYALLNKKAVYQRNPLQLARDIEAVRKNFNSLVSLLNGNVSREWGKDEILTATRSRYVKYTQNYKSRAIINFDDGLVTIETLVNDNATSNLHNAIVTTLLTPNDPRAVDLFSDKKIKLAGTPFLYKLVVDNNQRYIDSPETAEQFAHYLITNHQKTRQAHGENPKHVLFVTLNLVNEHNNIRARRYEESVNRYAEHFNINKSLIYAVIKTESNFNPFAVSHAPAYGLMQLVPTSGGRDAYYYVKGKDIAPRRDYLFDPDNNIELGTAYLNIIERDYLKNIQNPVSREYCTIAAYNTGSGNVLRTFSSNRETAVNIINSLHPAETYNRLRSGLNSQEARRYLEKVTQAQKEFVNI